jgi:uncharacterized repeat protein (TIGR03803 family)
MGRLARTGLAGMAVAVAMTAGAGFAPAQVADHVLVSFGGLNGAGSLSGVSVGPGGTLYGTTVFGGKKEIGAVFRLTPAASGGYTEKVLYSFTNAAGNRPDGNVVMNASGDLFGVTIIGGADDQGVVYELTPSGSGYTEKVLHSFTGGLDGGQPLGPLVRNASGDLFGVTQFGGTGHQGVIFEFKPSGAGYTEQVLHNFPAGASLPQAGLTQASDGTLYGTTYGASPVDTNGTVFSLALTKAGPVYHRLYAFAGGTDGSTPFGLLTVDNKTGVIYGTTEFGGSTGGKTGYGTVFSLTPSGTGYTERVLHGFTTGGDGLEPEAPVLLTTNGDLYGTTSLAGVKCSGTGCGTIFELVPAGPGSYTFKLIHQFTGTPDGADPEFSGLVQGPGGLLYGTTRSGGTATGCSDGGPGGAPGCGTVYTIKP